MGKEDEAFKEVKERMEQVFGKETEDEGGFSNAGKAYYARKIGTNLHPKLKSLLTEIACTNPRWAYHLRHEVSEDLSEEEKRLTEKGACKDAEHAYRLRQVVSGISEETKHLAERKACTKIEWACHLRSHTVGLSEEIKWLATKKVCEDFGQAFILRKDDWDLSVQEKYLLEEKLCSDPIWAFYLRISISDISETTKHIAEKTTQKLWKGTPETLQAIQRILPRWILVPIDIDEEFCDNDFDNAFDTVFGRWEETPLFAQMNWILFNSEESGALIGNTEQTLIKVVLLPDVSIKEKGYAIRVPPETKTVKEARAWMYREPVATFEGFTQEV